MEVERRHAHDSTVLPQLVIDPGNLGTDTMGSPIMVNNLGDFDTAGEIAEAHYSPQKGNWYGWGEHLWKTTNRRSWS